MDLDRIITMVEDQNDLGPHGMDPVTRKRLKVKMKGTPKKKPDPPIKSRMPYSYDKTSSYQEDSMSLRNRGYDVALDEGKVEQTIVPKKFKAQDRNIVITGKLVKQLYTRAIYDIVITSKIIKEQLATGRIQYDVVRGDIGFTAGKGEDVPPGADTEIKKLVKKELGKLSKDPDFKEDVDLEEGASGIKVGSKVAYNDEYYSEWGSRVDQAPIPKGEAGKVVAIKGNIVHVAFPKSKKKMRVSSRNLKVVR